KPVISHLIDSLTPLARDIFIVARDVACYEDFGLPVCADHYEQKASLVGIYSALAASRNDFCFTVACDMPFVEPLLVSMLAGLAPGHDAVMPVSQRGPEPLHALYSRTCMRRMREQIEAGDFAIHNLLDSLNVRYVDMVELAPLCDPDMVFLNVNTIVDLEEAALLVPRMREYHEQALLMGRPPGRPPDRPPLLCFVGKSDSGKTGFLEKLIPELGRRGVDVACIKHDAHGFTVDREGTDTWRLSKAGAKRVAISSPKAMALMEEVEVEKSLDELYATVGAGVDLVIAEGFKRSATDKIEVCRRARSGSLTCPESELVAVISDRPDAALTIPVFGLEDVRAVASLIMIRYGIGSGGLEVKCD
ncbi:MAG: molybdopterin-guanine dinucleotide biosynthesis protein B, partial [Thermoleophilia bacterium]